MDKRITEGFLEKQGFKKRANLWMRDGITIAFRVGSWQCDYKDKFKYIKYEYELKDIYFEFKGKMINLEA